MGNRSKSLLILQLGLYSSFFLAGWVSGQLGHWAFGAFVLFSLGAVVLTAHDWRE